jgi:protein-disulfide isomerase
LNPVPDLCHKQAEACGESPVSRKQILIGLGAAVVIALGVAAYYVLSPSGTTAAAGTGPNYTITPRDRTQGNPKAKVVLIEYAAPSCPVCAAFNAQTFDQLKKDYIDTGKVFYVFRIFPLRPDDGAAEKIARCLPEDKYFSFIDLLFRNQPKWDVEYASENAALQTPDGVRAGLITLGRIAGMSADEVNKCMTDTKEDDIINKVAAEGESRYNITGTPTFIVDGKSIGSGNLPYADVRKALDNALAEKH